MSNARFSILQARAVKDRNITDAQFRTLAALGMYADQDGWCFPMLSTLGKDLQKSKQSVGRDTIALRKLGYLEVHARYNENGGRRSNLYRLRFDSPIVNMGDSTPSTPEVDTPSTPEVDVNVPYNAPIKKSKLSKEEIKGVEASMYGSRPTTQEDIDPAKNQHDALDAFEVAFKLDPGNIAWFNQKPEWGRLRRKLVEKYLTDPEYFKKYRIWYDEKGKFAGGMNVQQMRRDPDGFVLALNIFEADSAGITQKTDRPNITIG